MLLNFVSNSTPGGCRFITQSTQSLFWLILFTKQWHVGRNLEELIRSSGVTCWCQQYIDSNMSLKFQKSHQKYQHYDNCFLDCDTCGGSNRLSHPKYVKNIGIHPFDCISHVITNGWQTPFKISSNPTCTICNIDSSENEFDKQFKRTLLHVYIYSG